MKQTVEEAARENILFNHRTVDRTLFGKDLAKFGEINFIQGAEWQSKQSPWISVKERLPEELESVLVGTNYEGRYYYEVAFVMNGKWVCHNSKPIYWMPIPSFDEIYIFVSRYKLLLFGLKKAVYLQRLSKVIALTAIRHQK